MFETESRNHDEVGKLKKTVTNLDEKISHTLDNPNLTDFVSYTGTLVNKICKQAQRKHEKEMRHLTKKYQRLQRKVVEQRQKMNDKISKLMGDNDDQCFFKGFGLNAEI